MTSGGRRVVVADNPSELAQKAAQEVLTRARQSTSPGNWFTIALSGGNTPRGLYEALSAPPYKDELPWDKTQVFFSDERFLPPTSPDSNYYLAEHTLLSRVPIPEAYVHGVPTVDIDPDESAALYASTIRQQFGTGMASVPRFDLILLGMGDDGHTASLFPDTQALGVEDQIVAANFVPQKEMWRITFTYPLLNAGRCVMFLVAGADKAAMVSRVFAGDDLPAGRVHPEGELIWLLDSAAAADLPPSATAS